MAWFVLPPPVYVHVLLVRSMVKLLGRDWVEYVIDVAPSIGGNESEIVADPDCWIMKIVLVGIKRG